jgi:GGDEF domain-containing protein
MEEDSFGIREAFKREPEQTSFLIKLVIGGALVVSVFSLVSSLLMASILVMPVALVLSLIYGTAVLLVAARLVFNAVSRRHMELGMAGRPSRISEEGSAFVPVVEQASFNHAYFMLRVAEEVANARRIGHEMTVVAIDATAPGVEMNPDLAERLAKEIAQIASNHHKTISYTLSVSESEYIMSLPNTPAAEAKTFVSHMVQSLGNYWCHFGTAVYPKDATTAEGMVRFARSAVEESHQGKERSKSHAVA